MVEVRRADPAVVHVLATRAGCAAASAASPDARAISVADDERLLLGASEVAGIADAVHAADPEGFVLDVSDGWTAWELAGPDAAGAFARLSELALPDTGSVQGEVARLPAKVVVEPDSVTICVPAMWGDYLGERIRTDCAAVGIREVAP